MNRCSVPFFVSLAVLALVAPAAYAEGIKIAKKIPYADPGSVREAIKKECDLENRMGELLAQHGGKMVTVTDANLAKAGGKVFIAKITGVWANPGPWGAASVLVEGELKDGGKVIGTVVARRNTTRGGGACGKLHVSANAVADDITGWMKQPTMDARLGDAAKKE